MHVFATQDQLAKALTSVTRVITPQNNMAILTGVQLEAEANSLRLTATDLFTILTIEIPVEVEVPGHMVLPASLFADLIQRIPTATIELKVEPDGKTIVKYGRNHATLHGFGSEMLPEFPGFDGALNTVTVPPGSLSSLARQLLFASARDETRPILRGVYMKLGNGRMVMVTTDGSRLSHSWIALPDYREAEMECVIPAKLLVEAARMAGTSHSAEITVSNSLIRVSTADGDVTSRLLEGQYPDYQRVIPQEYLIQGRARVTDFRGALERANLIAARDRTASVKVRHQVGQLDISASAAEFGQTFESIEFDSHGQDLELLFNPNYLLDALKSLEGEELMLEFSGVQSPVRISDVDKSQYSHVLLPLRQLV